MCCLADTFKSARVTEEVPEKCCNLIQNTRWELNEKQSESVCDEHGN
jgi:hypothetical protein